MADNMKATREAIWLDKQAVIYPDAVAYVVRDSKSITVHFKCRERHATFNFETEEKAIEVFDLFTSIYQT